MKIIFGILVIVVAVFLTSVELGTPLGPGFSLGQVTAPKPVPASSGRKLTGRGGRYARQKSATTPKPVAPEAQPGTSGTVDMINLNASEEPYPIGTYIEDPHRGFIKLEKGGDIILFRFEDVLIGIIEDDEILPIFSKRHEIIRIDYNKKGLRIPMNRTEAERWGVFHKYSEIIKKAPPAFLE